MLVQFLVACCSPISKPCRPSSGGLRESAGWGYDTLWSNRHRRGHASPTNELGQLDDEREQSGKPGADEPFKRAERGRQESLLQRRQLSREKKERDCDQSDA